MSAETIQDLFATYEKKLESSVQARFLANDAPLYIYGAGNMGKDICRLLQSRGRSVAGFLDRKAAPGSAWEGVPIRQPDDTAFTVAERQRARVVIAVLNSDADPAAIRAQLSALGYGSIISLVAFHSMFSAELGDRFWLGSREIYLAEKKQITEAYALFSDERSRALFLALLRWRLLDDDSALPAPTRDDQYFPADLPPWPGPLRFVDCGAYDGDTLRSLAHRGIAVEAIAAFEPDPANFRRLADSLRAQSYFRDGAIFLHQRGVGAKRATLRFAAEGGLGSRASETGEITIECVPLDEALADFRPNVIKMDIEGAELDALHGAQHVIRANQPGLAICLYHRADHLWKIPLFAAGLLPGARHYLRLHAQCGFELVYYARP